MNTRKLSAILLSLALLFVAVPSYGQSSTVPPGPSVANANITLTVSESETLTITGAGYVGGNIPLTGNASNTQFNSGTFNINASWSLASASGRTAYVCQALGLGNFNPTPAGDGSYFLSSVGGASAQTFTGTASSKCSGILSAASPSTGWMGPDIADVLITGSNLVSSVSKTNVISTATTAPVAPGSYSAAYVVVLSVQ
jgi:hypothetical protein